MDVIDDIEAVYEAMLDIDSLSTRKAAAVQRQWREALEKARDHIDDLDRFQDRIAALESEIDDQARLIDELQDEILELRENTI